MNGYTLTKVFKVNGLLVVADSIEKAVELYRTYHSTSVTIGSVQLVYGDDYSEDAIIKEEPSFEDVCNWLAEKSYKYLCSDGDGIIVPQLIADMEKDLFGDLNEPA